MQSKNLIRQKCDLLFKEAPSILLCHLEAIAIFFTQLAIIQKMNLQNSYILKQTKFKKMMEEVRELSISDTCFSHKINTTFQAKFLSETCDKLIKLARVGFHKAFDARKNQVQFIKQMLIALKIIRERICNNDWNLPFTITNFLKDLLTQIELDVKNFSTFVNNSKKKPIPNIEVRLVLDRQSEQKNTNIALCEKITKQRFSQVSSRKQNNSTRPGSTNISCERSVRNRRRNPKMVEIKQEKYQLTQKSHRNINQQVDVNQFQRPKTAALTSIKMNITKQQKSIPMTNREKGSTNNFLEQSSKKYNKKSILLDKQEKQGQPNEQNHNMFAFTESQNLIDAEQNENDNKPTNCTTQTHTERKLAEGDNIKQQQQQQQQKQQKQQQQQQSEKLQIKKKKKKVIRGNTRQKVRKSIRQKSFSKFNIGGSLDLLKRSGDSKQTKMSSDKRKSILKNMRKQIQKNGEEINDSKLRKRRSSNLSQTNSMLKSGGQANKKSKKQKKCRREKTKFMKRNTTSSQQILNESNVVAERFESLEVDQQIQKKMNIQDLIELRKDFQQNQHTIPKIGTGLEENSTFFIEQSLINKRRNIGKSLDQQQNPLKSEAFKLENTLSIIQQKQSIAQIQRLILFKSQKDWMRKHRKLKSNGKFKLCQLMINRDKQEVEKQNVQKEYFEKKQILKEIN